MVRQRSRAPVRAPAPFRVGAAMSAPPLRDGPAALALTTAPSAPAPLWRAVLAQTKVELLLSLRRGESVLVTLVIPIVLLAFFMSVGALPVPIARPIDFLLPGTLALAVMATGLANLGIATAYERGDGVLKRIGATPLPRAGLVAGKLLAGVVLPLEALPPWMAAVGHLLPAAALADTLRAALAAPGVLPIGEFMLLILWAVAAPLAAALTFRWE